MFVKQLSGQEGLAKKIIVSSRDVKKICPKIIIHPSKDKLVVQKLSSTHLKINW